MKVFLVLFMLTKFGMPQETVLEGDVFVEGIFSLYTSENTDCDTVNPFSVQVMEAVKWIYDQLNKNDFLGDIRIGLKVHKTCRSETRASEIAYNIARDIEGSSNTTVGVLGPEFSSEAVQISRLLGSLPDRWRLLQISHATTAPSLGDHELYRNFFRTIPSDEVQVEKMLHFMQKLNWTYVAIFHDDDTYGREAAQQLLAGCKYTCFPEVIPVDPQLAADEKYRYLENNILSLQTRTNPVTGIVLFGGYRLGETALQVINDLFRNSSEYVVPKILASEGFWSVERDRSNILNITKGMFLATPPRYKIEEIEEYWERDLLRNLRAVMDSVYLSDVYNSIKACDIKVNGTDCDPLSEDEVEMNFPQPIVLQYAVQAALVIAKTIKGVRDKVCTGQGTNCLQALIGEPKQSFINEMDSEVDFDGNFGSFRLNVYKSADPALIVDFSNKSSEPHYGKELSPYNIYNKQICQDGSGNVCLEEMYKYNTVTEEFELDQTAIRDYDPRTGQEFTIPDIKKPQCPPNSTCTDCKEREQSDLDITEGDLYVVGVAPVHIKSDSPTQCGPSKMGGFDVAEAIKFQIDFEMRTNAFKLPNAKIGSIIIDSCNDPQWITEKIVALHRRGIPKNGGYEKINDKIIGYVAGWVSDVSLAVAEILTRVKKVQISYGSTSPRLSDRELYPYFMRVVQSDVNQGKVMLQTVKDLGSNVVQLLYSDSAYGRGGKESVLEFAKDYDICVSNIIECPEDPRFDLNQIKESLTLPGTPKIIVSFLSSFDVVRLLKILNEMKGYVFVASEAWGNRDILDDAYNLNGSITLANELPISSVFKEHMKNLRPDRSLNQPWLQNYMEENFNCYFEWNYVKPADKRQCGPNDIFNPSLEHDGFKIETWVPFAATAVQSLLYGAAKALDDACGNRNALCDNFIKNPEILINHVKDLSIAYDAISAKKVFDSIGDGVIAYHRYLISKDKGKTEYIALPDDHRWPWSTCKINKEACKKCESESDQEKSTTKVEKGDNSDLVTAVIVLAVILAILIAICIFSIYAFKKKILFFKVKEDPYLTPNYLSDIKRSDGDGEMISTLSEKEENKRIREENKYI